MAVHACKYCQDVASVSLETKGTPASHNTAHLSVVAGWAIASDPQPNLGSVFV